MYQIKELLKTRIEIENLRQESEEIWNKCFPCMIASVVVGVITFFWYYRAIVTREIGFEAEDFVPMVFLIFLSCTSIYFFLRDFMV